MTMGNGLDVSVLRAVFRIQNVIVQWFGLFWRRQRVSLIDDCAASVVPPSRLIDALPSRLLALSKVSPPDWMLCRVRSASPALQYVRELETLLALPLNVHSATVDGSSPQLTGAPPVWAPDRDAASSTRSAAISGRTRRPATVARSWPIVFLRKLGQGCASNGQENLAGNDLARTQHKEGRARASIVPQGRFACRCARERSSSRSAAVRPSTSAGSNVSRAAARGFEKCCCKTVRASPPAASARRIAARRGSP